MVRFQPPIIKQYWGGCLPLVDFVLLNNKKKREETSFAYIKLDVHCPQDYEN